MKLWLVVPFWVAITLVATAQNAGPQNGAPDNSAGYSGMYTFLEDGEFIQITIEDGKVSGFISRFADSDAKGPFIDQFFKSGKSEGKNLSFTSQTVHGVWFTFQGAFDRGPGKTPGDEAYYVLSGTLTRFSTDAQNKVTSETMQKVFRSFPRDEQ
jgi:hypothetical protein